MAKKIVNLDEGIYLDMTDIKSFSVKEIIANAQGDKCFALVCYPGPGAGYVISRFNEETDALNEFKALLDCKEEIFYAESIYEEPEKKEAEVIGEAKVEE